jgi:cyclic 2,3-diphosphoglycerate synthetase
VAEGPVIALVDGEHHPAAVRELLDGIERERGLAGVIFCGGEEKLGPGTLEQHYGRPVELDLDEGLRRLAHGAGTAAAPAAVAVLDLADEPPFPATAKLRAAALALALGLRYETPGAVLTPPRYERLEYDGPVLAVIGTGKRTGKTAVAGHWASLLKQRSVDPVIVCMGRGGPSAPQLAEPDIGLDELIAITQAGGHAASDYLEDAVIAGVRSVGCRRVGGGLTGQPASSNVADGAELAARLGPDAIVLEGSGACIPPLQADRTVCVLGAGPAEPFAEYRLARADLVLAAEGALAPPGAVPFSLRPEPLQELPPDARVALFTTGAPAVVGVEPVVRSANLARRSALGSDLADAERERCDVWLTELKAAAIDTVALRAQAAGARVVFLRNRPVGVDEALLAVYEDARGVA